MTQHQFPMFVTPNEAGVIPIVVGYSAYLLGHSHVSRTPEPDTDEAADGDDSSA